MKRIVNNWCAHGHRHSKRKFGNSCIYQRYGHRSGSSDNGMSQGGCGKKNDQRLVL